MVNGLSSLISLNQVLHLTVGRLLCNRSTVLTFTHMLHIRYKSKEDLEAYSAHLSHIGVVRGSVLPIIDDLMTVDWVAEDVDGGELVPNSGSAICVTFLKLKEGVVSDEVVAFRCALRPTFLKGLDKETHLSGEWMPTWSSGDLWQVHHPYNGLQW
ncbi:stress-response A/B barrel domain-containing protein UP3-like [Vicia villosa]|uniref:stress-response A/B barrel domain-containing protein UP3-like n=1 Tax=Vicia villosa TaxID=3911 RepID=UPI00273A8447|nr:stress-response A/B barrel domain-containing protein UP3-like [Vicia villosa]